MMFDAVTYFENIARKLKAIGHTDDSKHFFRTISATRYMDLLNSASIAQYPALIAVDKMEGRLEDRTSNNLIDRQYHGFFIIMPARDNAPAEVSQATRECRSIVNKIIGKMTRDWIADNKIAVNDARSNGMRNLNRESISYQQVGPLGDNLHGIYVSFTIDCPIDTKYNEADWN